MSSNSTLFAGAAGMVAVLCSPHAFALENMDAGKKLFTQIAVPACAVCHTLKHAGAAGKIGPNLDELKPDASRVEKAVRNGNGQMPAFNNLSDEQIKTLSQYVAKATSESK